MAGSSTPEPRALPVGPAASFDDLPAEVATAATRPGLRARVWARRWMIVWLAGVLAFFFVAGIPTSRPQIFAMIGLGLIASGAGTKGQWKKLIIDFVPFFALLTAYDALRSSVNNWLMPHALPQIRIDEALFGGTVPTVTLQRAFYTPGVAHVWDYAAFATYMTYFIVPFVIAGLLWKYNHQRFRRYAVLLIGLTFAAFFTYALYPAVPPWMAAQNAQIPPVSKIIDEMWTHIGIANGAKVFSGAGHFANPVAAVPSLHSAYPMLIVLFFWKAAGKWRPLLLLYPLAMALTLVYTGEHYVIDILLGWMYAVVIYVYGSKLLDLWDRRRQRRPAVRMATA